MQPLRIGVVGAGAIAQRNARDAEVLGVAKITGVFDTNHKVARDMSKALKVPFFSTYEDLLQSPSLDAVLISVPHHLHRPLTIQAANAKKHVFVEKPMANNLQEAEEMIKACKENGVALSVNYSFRYLPKIQKAKQLIDEGVLDQITGVQIIVHQFKDPGYWTGARSNSPDDWRASRSKCGGGYLIMNVCHVIDYVYFMTGVKAQRIYSEYNTLGSKAEVEDIISVSFRLENGGIGTISASSIMRGTEQFEVRIWGTKGTLILDEHSLSFYSTRPVSGKKPGKLYKLAKFPDVSWTAEWVKHTCSAISKGLDPDISYREGWENLAFITSAYDSLEKQEAVRVPDFMYSSGVNV